VSNGCETLLNGWADDAECNHLAQYRCGNGLFLTIAYENDWTGATLTFRRPSECESSATATEF
jgi:hypothetical protein